LFIQRKFIVEDLKEMKNEKFCRMTSSTSSSGGKLLGISGNEETGTAVPDSGK
jgi:hypothetical protein